MVLCNFCKNTFNSISALNNHQKKAKYCLNIQITVNNSDTDNKFKCNTCSKILSSKQSLENHKNICNLNKKQTKLNLLDLIKEKDKIIYELKIQINYFEKQNSKQEEQIKDLVSKLDKIANKAIDRPTITNNTVNNKIELQALPSQMEIDRKIESQFNDKYLWDGIKGVAQFVFDHIVKLEDGSMAYACFDTSRQIFKYKDENGNEIKDPKAVKLRRMIKPGLLKQSQTLLDYFSEECDYLEKRKTDGMDIDRKEYNTMNTLREKAFEVGCEILSIEDTNKFSTELATLSSL